MSAPEEIPETVTVDVAALDDAVFWLGLMEEFLMFHDEAGVIVDHYNRPGATAEKLADWVGAAAAYLRRQLCGIPQ